MDEIKKARDIIENYKGDILRIMEVCGTHTHEIFKLGIRNILPDNIKLISGPGCPVCVTPVSFIDKACYLALEKDCTICTFGDLIRVPGTSMSLADARSKGADIRIVYSPADSVELAKKHPEKEIVFLAVGFETTTPIACIALKNAIEEKIDNFSLLVSNKTMDMAYRALKGSADAFLFPGHVSVITGTKIYHELKEEGISGVVTGFTANEILSALAVIIRKTEKGEPFFVNCYPRVVTDEGNAEARKMINKYFEKCDTVWRGIGMINGSGLKLKKEYEAYDAEIKYDIPKIDGKENSACRCGEVLKGDIVPSECPLFGKTCTTEHPVGACMVSSEGACSAFYKYSI